MARKTFSTKKKSKNRPRISTAVQSKFASNTYKESDQENGKKIHENDENECKEGVCDCIQRRGRMFLPPNLLESYDDSLDQKR